jgi:hypothetical protein
VNAESSRAIRWLPLLAALLGVVSGIAGALIGGKVANDGQEKQFRNQRIAELQDLLITDYGRYVRAAEVVADDSSKSKSIQTVAKVAADEADLSAAEAEVHLVASPELWALAKRVRMAFDAPNEREGIQQYRKARDDFIDKARQEINAVAE